MARRRLGPARPPFGGDVARAEHLREPERGAAAAPIARVAADAAGNAALREMADALAQAREDGRMVLDLELAAIAPDHLIRDRLPVEDEAMAGLRESLRAHGQRTPVEVTPLEGPLPYGLISGWRRLAALKALHAETGEARFATVRALVRRPESAASAYVGMVEENEIRAGLSHYERARVAALAVERGIFETEKKALLALFANVSRAKRSRIRAFLEIYHALEGVLRFPAHLPERLGLRLVEMVRADGAGRIAAALNEADPQTPEAEQALLKALVARPGARPEASARTPDPGPVTKRQALRPGVAWETRLRGEMLTLRFSGPGVGPGLRDELAALLRRWSAPLAQDDA